MRSGSVSGSEAGHPRLQRKFSNTSCPPNRNMMSTSVFDLNAPIMNHRPPHGYPLQQVIYYVLFSLLQIYFIPVNLASNNLWI